MPPFWDPSALPYEIDWSAWATLVAGLAAVAGAILVGLRQAKIAARQASTGDRQAEIMRRQSEIAAQQVAIEGMRLKAELYDRRVAVFADIERYAAEASMNGGDVAGATRDALFEAMSKSAFLLDANVKALAKDIYLASMRLRRDVPMLDHVEGEARTKLEDQAVKHHDDINKALMRLEEAKLHYLALATPESAAETTGTLT